MIELDGLICLLAVVGGALGLFGGYWLTRLAVRHGVTDAMYNAALRSALDRHNEREHEREGETCD